MRKLVLAISALALAGSAASPTRSPTAGPDEGDVAKYAGGLSKMVKARRLSTPRRCWRSEGTAATMREDSMSPLVSRPAATRATPRPLRKSGKTWPGFKARWTNSRPTAAAVAAPAQDLDALKRSFDTIGGRLAAAATRPTHQEGMSPLIDGLLKKLAVAVARPGRRRRGGVLVSVGADHASTPRNSGQRSALAMPAAASAFSMPAAARPAMRGRNRKATPAHSSWPAGSSSRRRSALRSAEYFARCQGRHRRVVARRFRQRHAARRLARRPALLSGLSLSPPTRA